VKRVQPALRVKGATQVLPVQPAQRVIQALPVQLVLLVGEKLELRVLPEQRVKKVKWVKLVQRALPVKEAILELPVQRAQRVIQALLVQLVLLGKPDQPVQREQLAKEVSEVSTAQSVLQVQQETRVLLVLQVPLERVKPVLPE
jgi:hypothetical protein